MRFEEDVKLDFKDVLLRPKRNDMSSRADVDLLRQFSFKHSKNTWTGIPIMTSNMDTVGTFEMYTALEPKGLLTCFHKYYTVEDYNAYITDHGPLNPERFILSTGIRDKDIDNIHTILNEIDNLQPKFLCIDVANGYSNKFLNAVRKFRERYPSLTLIGGNVVTREMVEQLSLEGGLDIIKIGLGNGSVCTTRVQTGVGYPQLSAVIECADAAHGLGTQIISDGGVQCPGDISKAFGAGADFVMSGSLFAGHTECPGTLIVKNGKEYKEYYGMSSSTSMEKHYGKVDSYRAAEGIYTLLPHKGSVDKTIQYMLGGIRSTCTYIGAKTLKDIPKCTTFMRVNRQVNDLIQK